MFVENKIDVVIDLVRFKAAAEASAQLAELTTDSINRVEFDANGKVPTKTLAYQKRDVNEGDK